MSANTPKAVMTWMDKIERGKSIKEDFDQVDVTSAEMSEKGLCNLENLET